jgi:hypothetical protein
MMSSEHCMDFFDCVKHDFCEIEPHFHTIRKSMRKSGKLSDIKYPMMYRQREKG